jgi:hypothetical protein
MKLSHKLLVKDAADLVPGELVRSGAGWGVVTANDPAGAAIQPLRAGTQPVVETAPCLSGGRDWQLELDPRSIAAVALPTKPGSVVIDAQGVLLVTSDDGGGLSLDGEAVRGASGPLFTINSFKVWGSASDPHDARGEPILTVGPERGR